jgi:hypothetical protein
LNKLKTVEIAEATIVKEIIIKHNINGVSLDLL